jgi:hypothetical protein
MLHYLRRPSGRRELVAVEWVVPVLVNGKRYFGEAEPPEDSRSRKPRMFGRKFDGPIPPTIPGQPWHYSVHLWPWRENPEGLFAPFHKDLRCPRSANGGSKPAITFVGARAARAWGCRLAQPG